MLRFAVFSLPAIVHAITVNVPLTAPSGSPVISPSLISFSIEQDRWTDWVGATSRNTFFFNALENIAGLSGEVPHIRVGADSEDHTNFNPGLQSAQAQTQFPPPTSTVPYPEATSIVVGDAYYEAAQFLPPNTHVTWGVNFGQNNITAAFLEAQSITKVFSSYAVKDAGIVLDLVEIGNEADLYRNNGLRSSSFNISTYVSQWIPFATNVSAAAGISSTSTTKFQGGAFAGSSHTATGFSPQGLFSNGILSSTPGSLITVISEHHYSGSFCSGNGGLLQDLMTKSTIRSNLSSFSPDIAATHAQGLDYVLGETNSYSCHGAPGVSNTAGAALWALDYALFSPQIGISRLFFHEGIGYKYNFIQPVTLTRSITDGTTLSTPLAPHVQPAYYAAIIAAEAIGKGGNTKATEISIDNTRIAGYAFFDGLRSDKLSFVHPPPQLLITMFTHNLSVTSSSTESLSSTMMMTTTTNSPFTPSTLSSSSLTSVSSSSSATLLPSSNFLPSFVPAFPFLPSIRVPPLLPLPETPFRERRGFTSSISFTTSRAALSPAPMPAKGHLEPRNGALPRRRRASIPKPVILVESKRFDFTSSDEED